MTNHIAAKAFCGVAILCVFLTFGGCGTTQTPNNNFVPAPAVARVDWGTSLTPGGSNGVGQFPAKFTFDVTAAPDCVNDFVAYNNVANFTNTVPGPNIAAFNHLYSTPGEPITLHTETRNGFVFFSVADRGPGIDQAEVKRIFEKFYRGKDHRCRVQGTGMGLPIAKAIVEAHGGTVGVTSKVGDGSVFYFSLPIDRSLRPD